MSICCCWIAICLTIKQEDVELSPYVIKAHHKPAYYNGDTLRLNAQFTQIVGFHARVRFKW